MQQIWTGIGIVIAVIALFNSFAIIEPGNTGVLFNRISGSLRTVGQGLTPKLPFITQVQSYPTALRTYTMVAKDVEGSMRGDDSIDLPTKEGQHIKQDISITYNTSEEKAAQVFRSFRGADMSDIESTFIRRTIITAAQNVAGMMSLSELISNQRDKLQDAVAETLKIEFEKMGFELDKVNLGASHLPAAIEQQMQQKMAAQQTAQQAEYELQKQQTLAKAKVAEAQGRADSLLVEAKAQAQANRMLSETLTPMVIESKKLDRWDGVLPQVTGGATPFITMEHKEPAKK